VRVYIDPTLHSGSTDVKIFSYCLPSSHINLL